MDSTNINKNLIEAIETLEKSTAYSAHTICSLQREILKLKETLTTSPILTKEEINKIKLDLAYATAEFNSEVERFEQENKNLEDLTKDANFIKTMLLKDVTQYTVGEAKYAILNWYEGSNIEYSSVEGGYYE